VLRERWVRVVVREVVGGVLFNAVFVDTGYLSAGKRWSAGEDSEKAFEGHVRFQTVVDGDFRASTRVISCDLDGGRHLFYNVMSGQALCELGFGRDVRWLSQEALGSWFRGFGFTDGATVGVGARGAAASRLGFGEVERHGHVGGLDYAARYSRGAVVAVEEGVEFVLVELGELFGTEVRAEAGLEGGA
jgi:hypothetical protein